MRQRCFLTLFVASIVWLALANSAAGETRIEVDENGDEYELKRFYIQGRQLSGTGSKSQCVVTRRKRASRSMALPAAGVSVSSQSLSLSGALPNGAPEHREVVTDNSGKRRYVALTALQLENAEDDDEEEDDDDDEEQDDEEETQHDDEEEEEDEEDVQQLPQIVPVKVVEQSPPQTNLLAATFALPATSQPNAAHLPQGVSVVANAATHANVGGDAGIVVIESEQPPKVNPSTHAVFELKPLKQQLAPPQPLELQYWPQDMREFVNDADADDDDDDEDDELFYYGPGYYDEYDHFVTEDSPVSTSAIWSTDNSDIHPVINEVNQHVDEDKKKQKQKRRKPSQESTGVKRKSQQQKKKRPIQQLDEEQPVKETSQKRKKQQQQQQSNSVSSGVRRKPSKKPASSSVGSSSDSASAVSAASSSGSESSSAVSHSNKRKRPSSGGNNKRKTSTSQRQKPKKKKSKKPRPSNGVSNSNPNKRRRPSGSSSSSSAAIGGYKRRRPQSGAALGAGANLTPAQRRRRKQQQQEKRRRQELQRRRRRRNKNRQNGGGNRRRYYGDEPIINCIYINKDPPATTTTARPFWNILGRDAANPAKPAPAGSSPGVGGDVAGPVAGDFGLRKRTNLRFVA